jgi:hypothetical protein
MAKLTAETYTDAELLALYRQALADLSVAQTTILRGKTVTRATIPQIKDMIVWLEKRVNGTGIILVHSQHARRTELSSEI